MKTKNRCLLVYFLIALFVLSIVSPGLADAAQSESGDKVLSAFKDVNGQDPNLAFINYLSSKGIIKGFPDGGFHPGEGLTRAQAAAIVTLAGGIKTDPSLSSPFADVRADYWARTSIAAAVKAGYISGFPDKTFRPEDKLTRAQASSMILRLSKQPLTGAVLPQLSDINSNHWAAQALAVAISSGMLGLSADKQQVYPDQAISRGDLARALGVLLTRDPDLSQAGLTGKLTVKNGSVTVQSGADPVKTVTGTAVVSAGDIISTDKSGEADISYGDGSGFLLKGDTNLVIKEARGRSYIKANGQPGVAIDWLSFDLKKGKLFGALASSTQVQENQGSETKTTGYVNNRKKVAALGGRELIAETPAGSQDMPWYETSKTKKVKVKVDMPWGVAAIRGTFWSNMVNANGTGSTSVLTGTGEVTSGGQTVSLGAGQLTQGTSANTPPAPPQTMSQAQASEWAQAAQWAQQRAEAIQQNQEASPTPPPVNTLQQQVAAPPAVSLTQVISTAINQAQTAAGSAPANNSNTGNTSGSSGGSGGGGTNTNPGSTVTPLGTNLGSYSLTNRVTVAGYVYDGGVLTQDFSLTPSADLAARATHYELWAQLGTSDFVRIGNRTPMNQAIRHLKKAFNQPTLLRAVFYNSNTYMPVASAQLNSTGSLANQADKTISGTVSLPAGLIAPAGGIQIDVNAQNNQYAFGGYGQFEQRITIPAGSNSAAYTLSVADITGAISEAGYNLSYKISGTYSEKYVMSGRYTSLINVAGGSQANKDMTIQLGKVISGTISLPQTATADLSVGLMADGGDNRYYTDCKIAAGQISGHYSVVVPAGANYKLSYSIYDAGNNNIENYLFSSKYLRTAFYGASGTVAQPVQAASITMGTADIPNINMQIMTGNIISGTVTLANSQLAGTGGVNVMVNAIGSAGISLANILIPAGSNSAPYSLVVAPGTYNVIAVGNAPSSDLVNASSGDASYNLVINLPGTSPQGALPTIPPSEAANRSVLVGSVLFSFDNPGFTDFNVLTALHSGSSLYYKDDSGQWYNLASAESAANLGSPITNMSGLPPIFAPTTTPSVIITNYVTGDDYVTVGNIPDGTTVKVFDTPSVGGTMFGMGTAAYDPGSGTVCAKITIPAGFGCTTSMVYYTLTPPNQSEGAPIPATVPMPLMKPGTNYTTDTVSNGNGKVTYLVSEQQKAAMEAATGRTIASIRAFTANTNLDIDYTALPSYETGVLVPIGSGVAVNRAPGNYAYAIAAYDSSNNIIAYQMGGPRITIN